MSKKNKLLMKLAKRRNKDYQEEMAIQQKNYLTFIENFLYLKTISQRHSALSINFLQFQPGVEQIYVDKNGKPHSAYIELLEETVEIEDSLYIDEYPIFYSQ